jgi:cytochrome P450
MESLRDLVRIGGLKEMIASLFATWLLYWLAVGIYRVYFHPLAGIPGPKLAAFTFWYEFYYEIYPNKFQYLWKIKQLHGQYGPIIRINPIQVHVHDADYFETIYASGTNHKRDRCSWFLHAGSKTWAGATLDTLDHDLHKMRRNAISPFFSKRSVQALEGLVVNNTKKLLSRLHGELGKKGPDAGIVNLNNAYAGFTMDIISEYCFGESMKSLEKEEYGKEWLDIFHQGIQIEPLARQFPTICNLMLDLPPYIVAKLDAGVAKISSFNEQMLSKIERILRREDDKDSSRNLKRTIFHDIRDDVGGKLPESEKQPKRLMVEATVVLAAGTETTAKTMAITTFYLIKNTEAGEKLRRELKTVMPTVDHQVTLPQLEALPYLTAVINEGLRVAHPVSSRQPRIATGEDLQYAQYTLPRGTPVMESGYLLHTDPTIYPDPFSFRPERWLENPKLTRYLFTFGRGSRNCVGMNLAMSELYFGLAMIWRRFELEIWDTVEKRDVLTSHDCFLGMPDLGSEGIKARVVGEVEE